MLSIILVLALLGVVALFAIDRDWTNVTKVERNDIVFENKNKSYGAFVIRSNYNKSLLLALGLSVAFVVIVTAVPVLLSGEDEEEVELVKASEVNLLDLPPPKEDEVLPPPPPPPPPVTVKQIQFTEPDVTTEEVETPPPPQDNLDKKIGTTNVEGPDEGPIAPVDPGAGIDPDAGKVFTFVEQQPEFPGGEAALFKYLGDNIRYPEVEKENGIQGQVILTFVVDKNGEISNISALRDVKGGPALTKEAIRVVKGMPKWKPGKMNGKSVNVQYNLPVRFVLR